MSKKNRAILLAVALATAAAAPQAWAAELALSPQDSTAGTPYGLRLEESASGLALRGAVRRSALNPSRRLGGQVVVEVLNAGGRVIGTRRGEVYRAGPGRHTARGDFELRLGALPASARALRVTYRQP